MGYSCIEVDTRSGVGVITLSRPEALNALNSTMIDEIGDAAEAFDANPRVGAILISGAPKAFAAGADIKEMADLGFVDAYLNNQAAGLERVSAVRKPVVAAVCGYCLGGGNELAMMCDIVIASDTAKFGQPEITLGIIPGIGATQRLARAVGKAKAMDLIMTGRMMDAAEAESSGLVARVVPADEVVDQAFDVAARLAELSLPSVLMAKEAVNRAFETPLSEGLRFERRLFHATFATEDQKEGMAAFLEKRTPQFRNR